MAYLASTGACRWPRDVFLEPHTLRIGQLAARAGVNVETIRFYEREGLLERPYQHPSGYRAYPASEVEKGQAIKRAQALRFKLAEIRDLLKWPSTGQLAELASQKLQEIDASIGQLVLARDELVRLEEYRCDRLIECVCGEADCPVHPVGDASDGVEDARPALQVLRGGRTGLLASGAAAVAGAVCCASVIGGLLAALGIPALTVTGGAVIGLTGAAVAAAGAGVIELRRRRARRQASEAK